MTSAIEQLSHLVIGSVESVAPNEVRVLLELDAPHTTALNTGTPAPFPRINGYVLIPNEAGATVGYIAWIGIERSPYPKRSGMKDFGLIDLPFPLRKMNVSPVGTLRSQRDRGTGKTRYELSRGILAFPSVGDQVCWFQHRISSKLLSEPMKLTNACVSARHQWRQMLPLWSTPISFLAAISLY
jgi:hypothetical protein